jgi:hypothetical protein
MKQYTSLLADGTYIEVSGVDAPVEGLAVVRVPPCDCGADLYAVLHVRSGSGLFFTHDPVDFDVMWNILFDVDWTRSTEEIRWDRDAHVVYKIAFRMLPEAFLGKPVEAGDVPGHSPGVT